MLILGFDTSAAHCAAALLDDDRILAAASEEMSRGQADRLMPLLNEVLNAAQRSFQDLDRIGVGIGPGNFTGIRIAVSAARGLALGLGIPAIGVDSFDATEAAATSGGRVCVAAPRGQGYLRDPETGDAVVADVQTLEAIAAGPGLMFPRHDLIAIGIARVAASRTPDGRPAPLYLRPADAAPPRDAPPVILDDPA